MFEQVLRTITPEYSDKINFYEVDIEEEPQIASLFRVMSVPQVSMIRKDGSKEQSIGSMDEDSLKYWLEGLIS
jgi:thioredoxin 1